MDDRISVGLKKSLKEKVEALFLRISEENDVLTARIDDNFFFVKPKGI